MSEKKNAKFGSRWGFILAAVGSAVGMANVWGFPAKMGANGGGAFLVAYLIFVVLFSLVGLSAEYAIGRRARTGALGAYRKAWQSRSEKLGKLGGGIGWLPLLGSMCIAIGYAVIIAYVLFYPGLNAMAEHGLGGMSFSIITGSCIVSFSAAGIVFLKERLNVWQTAGLICCISGLILICTKA